MFLLSTKKFAFLWSNYDCYLHSRKRAQDLGMQNVYYCPKLYIKLHEKCPNLPKSVPKFFQIKNIGKGAASMAPTAITNFQFSFIVDIFLHKILPPFNLFLVLTYYREDL